jgi:two-component system LytT family response regulator
MRTIIVDDEKHCRDGLAIMIDKHCPGIEIVAQCAGASAGLAAMATFRPQLLFLDIEMPEMNGFEFLEHCKDYTFQVIFTTAYNEYAIRAIRHSALDYLLKPVNKEELTAALGRAVKTTDSHPKIDRLLELLDTKKVSDRIALPTLDGLMMVDTSEILFCESDNNYTRFHLLSGKTIFISKTLKKVEQLLERNKDFFRIHNSYLINLRYVQRYIRGEGGEVIMQSGKSITVSRHKKQEFLDILERLE